MLLALHRFAPHRVLLQPCHGQRDITSRDAGMPLHALWISQEMRRRSSGTEVAPMSGISISGLALSAMVPCVRHTGISQSSQKYMAHP